MTRHKKHGIKLRSMYQWHRHIGISLALFILILAITGIMLNHTSQLGLDKKYIQANWLLNHYGIRAPEKINSFNHGEKWVSQWKGALYLNTQPIGKTETSIVGAIHYKDMVIIALHDAILIYTQDGELVERVSGTEGLPPGIEAIGITDKNLVAVRSANGTFTTNEEFLFWQSSASAISVWSDPVALPHDLYQKILVLYRGQGLKLERIIQDLHSGRILGNWGIYFTDFIALLMIFLASSGLWLWSMRIIKKQKHKRH